MLYGVRPDEQRAWPPPGYTVRVYVPYGTEWYGYLMRRLAERPANLAFFAAQLGLPEVGLIAIVKGRISPD